MHSRTLFAGTLLVACCLLHPVNGAEPMSDPSITIHGQINPEAPEQLGLFSFLIGEWTGKYKNKVEDGASDESRVKWIGRYVLNGMAIADELYGVDDKGATLVGLTLRSYDAAHASWVVEWLNVSASFLRLQVAPGRGSVEQTDGGVVLNSSGAGALIREQYRLLDADHFVYSMDMSRDEGQSWELAVVELSMERSGL